MKIINKLASYINSLKNKFINQEKKKISYKDISISSFNNPIKMKQRPPKINILTCE